MKFFSKLVLVIIASALLVFIPATSASASSEQKGDIVKLSGDVYVNDGTTATGNVVALNGNVYVDGVVNGDVVSVFGDIIVNNGKILGDAVTVTGKITVGQNGKIMGDTVEALGGISSRNGGYQYNNRPIINIPSWGFSLSGIIISFIFSLVMFGVAAIVYLIMPDKIEKMASTIAPKLGKRIGIGFLTLIGSPIALIMVSIILAITIIGIIVIPFVWIAFALTVFLAIVPVYVFIGRSIISNTRISGYLAIATGMFALWVVNTVLSLVGPFVSWVNVIISIGVFVLGTGTLLDFIFSNRKPKIKYMPNPQYPPQGGGDGRWHGDYKAPGQEQNTEGQHGSIPKDDNK